ncbi:DUF2786 domain-containing protein [Salmonella enterica]|uniref:DUF2786 domain-containing protein n=1 Tax=Salmonella enterica TaxID=28901 RepID=UPI001F3B91B7|nr:DUF2786 domain-containing protein [Salmonella enterica]
MENKEKYLARIKKLLRLARGTSSPEEAMNAMAKAQAYMRKCGVSESDVELSEVRECQHGCAERCAQRTALYAWSVYAGLPGLRGGVLHRWPLAFSMFP